MKIPSYVDGGRCRDTLYLYGVSRFVVANFVYMDWGCVVCVVGDVFFLRISLDTDSNSYYIYY